MNKKIIISLSVIAAVGAIVAGGTYAVWTAQDTIEGNTVGTATLGLNINEEGGVGAVPKPVNASNLLPGQWAPGPGYFEEYRAVITNQSTVPVNISMYVTITNETKDMCDYVLLNMRRNPFSEPYNTVIITGTSIDSLEGVDKKVSVQGEIASGGMVTVREKVQLDENAPDAAQGGTCEWTEVFLAETL